MNKEKVTEQINEDMSEKKGFIAWVKEHKTELLFAGISISSLLLTILGIKNKDAIISLWESLKKEIEKGSLYSEKWFETANLEELEKSRNLVQLDYMNPDLDMDYRTQCLNLLSRFDTAIRKLKQDGTEIGFPVHSSNGWHLPSDD